METISFVSCTIVSVCKSFPSREGQHSLTLTIPLPSEPGLPHPEHLEQGIPPWSSLWITDCSVWGCPIHGGILLEGQQNPPTAALIPFITHCCPKGQTNGVCPTQKWGSHPALIQVPPVPHLHSVLATCIYIKFNMNLFNL